MGEKKKSKLKQGLEDFKKFALKDNVVSLAVGVIIGAAFKDIVDSLVNNIFTPPIGFLTANLDFSKMFVTLGKYQYDTLEQAQEANAVVLQYGLVLNSLIRFLITAVVLYFVVTALERASKKEEKEEKKTTKVCPYCKSEIHIEAKRCPNCTSELK
jgi:large conductance mechanosensitive channel